MGKLCAWWWDKRGVERDAYSRLGLGEGGVQTAGVLLGDRNQMASAGTGSVSQIPSSPGAHAVSRVECKQWALSQFHFGGPCTHCLGNGISLLKQLLCL